MCDSAEKNFSIDILVKYMTHEVAEIRSGVYCSIAMLVAVRKQNSRNERQTIFVFRVVCPWKKQSKQ